MPTVTIKDVVAYLEILAPASYQEDYDNSGLLIGDRATVVKGILVTLDCTEEIIDEAIEQDCNMIVAHHPLIFKGLKKITGQTYVERAVIKAIKNDMAIYSIHTNLDNVHNGVNKIIAEKIGLKDCRILSPKKDILMKLVTFIPTANVQEVLDALYEAGAGHIGQYKNCSFQVTGEGTFTPSDMAHPFIGAPNKAERVEETRTEVIFQKPIAGKVMDALKKSHPYEEIAYYLSSLENANLEVGAGMIGDLENEMEPIEFLRRLKKVMNTALVRHTLPAKKNIKSVAICGGAGSFLLSKAISEQADAFVSADFKYHEFFDANAKIMVADIGHYESEQFTKDLLFSVLKEKFTTFAIIFSKLSTNPISYL